MPSRIGQEGSYKVGIKLQTTPTYYHTYKINPVLGRTGFVSLFVCLFQLIYFQSSGLALRSFGREKVAYLHSDLGRFPCENKLADSNPSEKRLQSSQIFNRHHAWTSSFISDSAYF